MPETASVAKQGGGARKGPPPRSTFGHAVDSAGGRAVMAQAQGTILAAAGVLGFVGVALPHPAGFNELGLTLIQLSAIASGAALVLFATRVPFWILRFNPPLATLATTAAIYFSGDVTSAFALFYLWPSLYVFYFFSRWEAAVNVAFSALNYALVIVLMGHTGVRETGQDSIHYLVLTVGTLAVAGASLIALRERITELISRLADSARRDALTGLASHQGFHETVEGEVERADLGQGRFSVLLTDLDAFERVNEKLGHQRGDETLQEVAKILNESCRRIDTAARTGGAQFAVVLPEADQHAGYMLAESLLARIRHRFSDFDVPLTMSIGVVSFPEHGLSVNALLKAGEGALVAAKALGRDRAVLYSPQVTGILSGKSQAEMAESQAQLATVLSLAEALDLRDTGTARHSQTVGRYSELMARELELPTDLVDRVRLAGVLHDIGKIGVPDSILKKPGPLTDEEWAQMRRHPELGARILGSQSLSDIREWVFKHHERPDGRGYPEGLRDEEIPVEAKILSVADAYEAMITDRVYSPAMDKEAAREELWRCAGTQFDETVVAALVTVLEASPARPVAQ